MQKPQLMQCEKKYLATAMVLFEYCAAFKILMREKTAPRIGNFSAGSCGCNNGNLELGGGRGLSVGDLVNVAKRSERF